MANSILTHLQAHRKRAVELAPSLLQGVQHRGTDRLAGAIKLGATAVVWRLMCCKGTSVSMACGSQLAPFTAWGTLSHWQLGKGLAAVNQ